MARPSKYTKAVGLEICRRIAAGETLVAICKSQKMPHRDTVYEWCVSLPEFSDMYARAKERCADAWFDEALKVAKEADDAGDPKLAPGSRLYVDTLKWAAAKLRPRTYSDKVQVEQDGKVRVVVEYADDPSDAS